MNVPYDRDMQARVDHYSMVRSRHTANDDEDEDTVKSFADGGQYKPVEFHEVPDPTRRAEYSHTLGNPENYMAAGGDKLMKLNQKEFEKLVQNDFESTMDDLNADMKFDQSQFKAY